MIQLEIRQALEGRQLPLPDSVYVFLFPPKANPRRLLPLQAFLQALRRRLYQITGKEDVTFNQMIDELIDFLNLTGERT